MRKFEDLSDKELLALAIGLEEEDGRIYADFAEGLRNGYPASAKVFEVSARFVISCTVTWTNSELRLWLPR